MKAEHRLFMRSCGFLLPYPEHSGGQPACATARWQLHSTGWEDCMCDRFFQDPATVVSVFCDTAQTWVFMLVSNTLWHSPSLGLHAGVKCIVTQPEPWCSCWCQMHCDIAQALVFLLVSKCAATQPKPRQQRPTSKTTCCPVLLFSLTHP